MATDESLAKSASVARTASVASSKEHHEQEGFSSRWAFWLTAIGCAVGFGNVWRFPYLCYKYGGLAFFVPYLFGLVLVVWPVLILEFGLGQMTQGGNIKCFSALGRRCRGFGMTGWTAFNICLYYPLLLTWTTIYFVNSFHSPLPWTITDEESATCRAIDTEDLCGLEAFCEWNPSGLCVEDLIAKAQDFFRYGCYAFDDKSLNEHHAGFTGISGWNVFCMFANWTLNFLGLVAGAKVLGYIMYVTMTLPTIFLIILVILGITLKGSGLGITQYVAKFDGASISGTDAWMSAIGQGIFSVGVAQGSAPAFSAHSPKKQNFTQDAVIVIVADTIYAFLAGFSVFAVIGHLATVAGKEINELPLNGISLAFATYPVGLSQIGGVGANIFCALFFMTLWFLGMDTLVGLTEACVIMVCDSRFGKNLRVKRWQVTLAFCLFFFLVPGLLLSTNLGSSFLDAIDTYSSSVAQAFGAGAEATAVGWVYLSHFTTEKVGMTAFVVHFTTWFLGSALLGLLFGLDYPAVAFPVGFAIMFVGAIIAYFLCNKTDEQGRELSAMDRLYYLTVFNVEPLRKLFNDTACSDSKWWRVSIIWSVLIKYVTPTIVCFLFFSSIVSSSLMYGRPSDDLHPDWAPYPWYIFLVGQLTTFGGIIIGTLVFVAVPDLVTPLLSPGQENLATIGEELVPFIVRPNQRDPEMAIHALPEPSTSDVDDYEKKPDMPLEIE